MNSVIEFYGNVCNVSELCCPVWSIIFFIFLKKERKEGTYVWRFSSSVGTNNLLMGILVLGQWDKFKRYCFDIFFHQLKKKNPQRESLFLEIFDALCKLSKHQQDLAERKWQGTDEVFLFVWFLFLISSRMSLNSIGFHHSSFTPLGFV